VTETNSLLLPRRNENPDFGSGSIFYSRSPLLTARFDPH
jgi:hypothetical protein